ncbi:MAG: hypothetical protein IKB85_00685 [Bacteroidales bacterium]|nr:hypothetical protein [Bacteroidales bacterium]
MKVEKNLYESPKLETTEIIVEQAILSASTPTFGTPTYGGFGEEEEL